MKRPRSPAEVAGRALPADPGYPSARRQTRGLTEGAILAALAAVIAAVGLVVPPVAVLLAPLPVMLLVIRWGLRTAVLAAVVAGLILLQFFGPLVAVSITVIFAPIGLALGWGVRRGVGAQVTVLAGSAAFLLSTIGTFGLTTFVLHQDLLGQLIQAQVQGMHQSVALLERFGAPQEKIDEIRLLADAQCWEHHCFPPPMEQSLRTVVPVGVALGALFWGYLCYTLGRSVFRRIGYEIPAVQPMLTWRLPRRLAMTLVWISAGLSGAGLWFPDLSGIVLSAVLLNLFVFGFQGALVAVVWMNGRQLSRAMQIIAFVALISMQAGLALFGLAILGMLDTWYDFRRLTSSPGANPQPVPQPIAPPERSARGPRAKAAHPQ
jgi:uncharacterized protein YybS (DUF2232 family)